MVFDADKPSVAHCIDQGETSIGGDNRLKQHSVRSFMGYMMYSLMSAMREVQNEAHMNAPEPSALDGHRGVHGFSRRADHEGFHGLQGSRVWPAPALLCNGLVPGLKRTAPDRVHELSSTLLSWR